MAIVGIKVDKFLIPFKIGISGLTTKLKNNKIVKKALKNCSFIIFKFDFGKRYESSSLIRAVAKVTLTGFPQIVSAETILF